MTVREFVQSSLKNKEEFGVKGYNLQRTNALDKPLRAIILPTGRDNKPGGEKPTYID